jgi:hypothetical protein
VVFVEINPLVRGRQSAEERGDGEPRGGVPKSGREISQGAQDELPFAEQGVGNLEFRRLHPPPAVEKKVQVDFTGSPFLTLSTAEGSLNFFQGTEEFNGRKDGPEFRRRVQEIPLPGADGRGLVHA